MAKFKIGDRVKIERWNKPTVHGKLLKYENGKATIDQDGAGTVTYEVDEDGITPLKSVNSSNRVVANAIAARTARNGNIEDKVRVTMDCFDFNGLRKVTKVMTLAALKQLLAQTKAPGATYERVTSDLERNGAADIAMDPNITLEASWASRA